MSFDFRRENLESMSVVDILQRWYHVPAIVAVAAFMFWVRVQSYDRFLRDDGGIWLQAVDSWYHWRATEWSVANFPWTIGYDPWTGFPDGTFPGQFGTVFDQIVAAVALIIGLGSPSEQQVLLAALITVPALAALVAIPTYYIGKRLGGRIGGLAAIVFLALAPGTFLQRSTAGMLQHHVAEVLFMTISVLALMVALRVAELERPIWELVAAREWDALRRPLLYSALAGFAMLIYVLTWPPGIVLIGIFGVYLVVQLSLDVVRGRSPDHIAFVGVVSMLVVAVGTALMIKEPGFSATGLNFFQPTFALLVAAGCLFMAWLARQWETRDIDPNAYPIAIAGAIVLSLLAMRIVLPDVYGTLLSNLTGRLLPAHLIPGLELGVTGLTVAEVQPPGWGDPEYGIAQHMFAEFGMAFYTAIIGIIALATRPFFGREQRAEHLLVVVWAVFLVSMGMTQVRFNYYLVVAVAVVNAYLVGLAVEWIDLSGGLDTLDDVESYQILTLGVVIMILLMPLLPPIAAASAVTVGEQVGPDSNAQKWAPANEYLNEHTPEVGNYAGAGNQDQIDYMGDYPRPADGSFDYPEGSYGVMSWWDYGHLITVQGERIPHSNPFQQNARSSSAFLTADTEREGELVLDAIAAGESPRSHTIDELEGMAAGEADDGDIQYVMIDDETAGGKFQAVTQWTDPATQTYFEQEQIELPGQGTQALTVTSDAYDETMTARLYLQDANGLEHYRLVHENEEFSVVGGVLNLQTDESQALTSFPLDAEDWNEELPGLDASPAELDAAFQQAAQQGQAVQLDPMIAVYDARMVSSVKTFERVEGATLEGQTLPNASVDVQVPIETNANRTFGYAQQVEADEEGHFEVTVSYPTDETLGPDDGYAQSAVAADGQYEITAVTDDGAEIADIDVSEEAIQTGETIQIEMEEADFDMPEEPEEPPEEEEGADEETEDDEEPTEDDTTEGDETEEDSSSIAPVRP